MSSTPMKYVPFVLNGTTKRIGLATYILRIEDLPAHGFCAPKPNPLINAVAVTHNAHKSDGRPHRFDPWRKG